MKSTLLREIFSLTAASLLLLAVVSAPTSANAAAPKVGSKCAVAGQKVVANNLTFTCTKSGKNLLWSKGVKVNTSNRAQSSGASSVTEGFLCDPAQAMTGKTTAGRTLTCIQGHDGKSSWRPGSQGSGTGDGQGQGQNQAQGSSFVLGPLGSACSKDSELGWNGSFVAKCKSGKVRYAVAADFPATPSGGYKARPTWYPTLQQIMIGGHGAKEPLCEPSSIKFTKPVVPLNQMAASIPYGMMIKDHVTPIDHAYFGITSLAIPAAERTAADYVAVTAPGDGTIIELSSLGSVDTSRVVIDHGCNLFSVYMVLNKPSGVLAKYADELAAKGRVAVRIKVIAGDEFGRQRDNPLDFNIFDGTAWLSGFANPSSYLTSDSWKPYTADFLPFFSDSIRSGMEKWMQKTSTPRVGKIDHDVLGSASGNWFLDGTFGYGGNPNSVYENATSPVGGGSVAGKNIYAWSHLAIAPHQVDSTQWIFSTGWWNDPKGDATQAVIVLGVGQVAPNKLTAASGAITYQLAQISYAEPVGSPARPAGSMASYAVGYKVVAGKNVGSVTLQVSSDGTLTMEIGSTGKRIYRR